MYLKSIKSVKQNAVKSVNRSTERKPTYRVWCLYSSFVHGTRSFPFTFLIQFVLFDQDPSTLSSADLNPHKLDSNTSGT